MTGAARVPGVARHTLSRVSGGHVTISPEIALRLEKAGRSNTGFRFRRQVAWNLAQARRREDRIDARQYGPQPAA